MLLILCFIYWSVRKETLKILRQVPISLYLSVGTYVTKIKFASVQSLLIEWVRFLSRDSNPQPHRILRVHGWIPSWLVVGFRSSITNRISSFSHRLRASWTPIGDCQDPRWPIRRRLVCTLDWRRDPSLVSHLGREFAPHGNRKIVSCIV